MLLHIITSSLSTSFEGFKYILLIFNKIPYLHFVALFYLISHIDFLWYNRTSLIPLFWYWNHGPILFVCSRSLYKFEILQNKHWYDLWLREYVLGGHSSSSMVKFWIKKILGPSPIFGAKSNSAHESLHK